MNNRTYFYKRGSKTFREEFLVIKNIVGKGKRVLDLGCGDGSLMQILIEESNKCKGVEISPSGVSVCKEKGLDVLRGRIDKRLPFKDKSFDFAICNTTMQMTMYPEVLVKEMVRVSRRQIITFPNFAFILNRIDLLLNGRFPRWSLFGYDWYTTGHIHQLSIKDFEDFCSNYNLKIRKVYYLFPTSFIRKLVSKYAFVYNLLSKFSNLFATMAVFDLAS
jgi:methionine biosynthesis protein MetW